MATASLNTKWQAAIPGDVVVIPAGDYVRETLKVSKRAAGSAPVELRGDGIVRLLADPTVGSTDALLLKHGLRDLVLRNLILQMDDRSALKTEGPEGARKISLIDCAILGLGAGPTDPAWKEDGTWGEHHWMTAAWSEINVRIERVFKEHAVYLHNIQGNHAYSRCTTKHCGRTRLQIVNRKKEVDTPMPIGKGDVTVLDDYVEDVCLEDGGGGSAYTFRGGMPTSTVTLERCTVLLGCTLGLAAKFAKNITGAVLMDSAGPSKPGAGDEAHDGGTLALKILEPNFQAGGIYPGAGSARRSNVKVGAVQEFFIGWGDAGRIVGGTNGIALEVMKSCVAFKYSGSPSQWSGKVLYKGTTYASWTAFAAAHPECRA